jgi:hypothetical protein
MRSLCLSLAVLSLGLVQAVPAGEIRDDELGFAFSAPNLGGPLAGQQLQRVVIVGPATDTVAPTAKVQIKQIQSTREALIEQSDKDFVTNQMTVKAKTLREVNGLPAVSYECEWTYQNKPMRMINLCVVDSNRIIILTCTALATTFPTYEAEFRKAVDSFVVRR